MKHPFQQLEVTPLGTQLVATVKSNLYVYNLDGSLVGSWTDEKDRLGTLAEKQKAEGKKVTRPGAGAPVIYDNVRVFEVSDTHIVGATDSDKSFVAFELAADGVTLVKRQACPKRPSGVLIVNDDTSAVVCDKFGDVFDIPFTGEPIDVKDLHPILGHVLLLNDVVMAEHDGKQYVITADRDEHIRVLRYPKAYIIEHWLFGHTHFVSCLHIPRNHPELLLSAGGDDFVCVWRWFDNELVSKIELKSIVAPFLGAQHVVRGTTEPQMVVLKLATVDDLVVILAEQTLVIMVFGLDGKHRQTVEVPHTVVDFAIDTVHKKLYAAVEDDSLVHVYDLKGDQFVSAGSANFAHPIDVGSSDEFFPLYTKSGLRKRPEH